MTTKPQNTNIVKWALACAGRVAELADHRATFALGVAQRWLDGEVGEDDVRAAALDAHRAAAASHSDSARLASRACAQAVGSILRHERAPHAASYARRAMTVAGGDADHELEWQRSIADDVVKKFLAVQVQPRVQHGSDEDE